MRALISEATRTVEDSQTAQALHGLLSLKSPADCPPSATSAVVTSVGELSALELIQMASSGLTEHSAQVTAADNESNKSPAKSPSQPATASKLVDRHATLRAAILSPSTGGLQPMTAGTAGSAVQILLQMQQDDATAAAKSKPLRAKLASVASAGNVSLLPSTSSAGINTTHVLLDRSPPPVKISAASISPKSSAVAASVPLLSLVQGSSSDGGQAVPIQLIATSQGVLAIPQNCQLLSQNAVAALSSSVTSAARTKAVVATASSPVKRRLSQSTSAGGLLKVAKLQTAAAQLRHGSGDGNCTIVQAEPPTAVVANSLLQTAANEGVLSDDASSTPNHGSFQFAVRDSFEKLFWKVYLQSSSFQNMPRPPVDGFNGSSEVSYAVTLVISLGLL